MGIINIIVTVVVVVVATHCVLEIGKYKLEFEVLSESYANSKYTLLLISPEMNRILIICFGFENVNRTLVFILPKKKKTIIQILD